MRILWLLFVLNISPVYASLMLSITTEEYAPLSYTESGILKGIATEQVEEILHRSGLKYEMQVYPWARALHLAQTQAFTCVFTTSNTPERRDLFKWVEPLSINMSVLIKHQDTGFNIDAMDEAKSYRIGVQNQDVAETFLRDQGFKQLDRADDATKSVLKLFAGRVDMVALAESRYLAFKQDGLPVEKVLDLFPIKMGLACHRSVPDDIIATMQAHLDGLIEDGTQQRLQQKYQPSLR